MITIGVLRTAIEDDSVGIYSSIFAELGRAAKVYPDELIFSLLKASGSTTFYDGQYFLGLY